MREIALFGTGVAGKSLTTTVQRRLNCYMEVRPDGDKTKVAIFGTPGLLPWPAGEDPLLHPLSIDPLPCIQMGEVYVGMSSAPRTVTLTNDGELPIVIASITATRGYAVSSNTCGTIDPGDSCTLVIVFTPDTAAELPGTLTVRSDADSSPDTYGLCGAGICADFGTVSVGLDSDTLNIPIYNWRGSTLTITSVTPSNAHVVASSVPASIAAGDAESFDLVFSPTAGDEDPGTVVIVSNAVDSPWTLQLCGEGYQIGGAFLVMLDGITDADPDRAQTFAGCSYVQGLILTGIVGTFSPGDGLTASDGYTGVVFGFDGGRFVVVEGNSASVPIGDTVVDVTSGASGVVSGSIAPDKTATITHRDAVGDPHNWYVGVKNIGDTAATIPGGRRILESGTYTDDSIYLGYGSGTPTPSPGTPFSVTPLTINAGDTASFQCASFSNPFVAGTTRAGAGILNSDALNPILTICLSLVRGTPAMVIDPLVYDGGSVPVAGGLGPIETFTITNTGTSQLGGYIYPPSGFGLGGDGQGFGLLPGQHHTFTLQFDPLFFGYYNTYAVITSNAGDINIPCTGTGT